ncbi:hypothetical protein Amsp01_037260 [Amycolatopsis sp. NBRC 101858]|uniref:hypothetical protein n=1 Tax=Amycolatopsis sp. NBRC 101858 TaxID=3032200 RepID=UPI0024A33598|nr:hypothetical protein [Amycolatopsis sp. NBRC 101858]GLY37702.1 hypothetical protein Amsp01_037260 [Amycolatopsis sp. NBRC 101858]
MRKAGLLVAGVVLVLAACDPGPGAAPPPAASAVLGAPAGDVAQLVAAVRGGIAQAPSVSFTLEATFGAAPQHATGSLRFDGGATALKMVADSGETRVLGRKTYTRTPVDAVPGKSWIGTDAGSADPVAQAMGAAVPAIVKLPDLSLALTELERTGRIVSAGQTRLDTVAVNHYRLEFDAAKAPELFPEYAEPPLDGKPAKPVTAKLPAELWLDAAQRPVRFAVELPGLGPGLKGTTAYHGWGEPVDIQPPPADQVLDAAELLKKMGR